MKGCPDGQRPALPAGKGRAPAERSKEWAGARGKEGGWTSLSPGSSTGQLDQLVDRQTGPRTSLPLDRHAAAAIRNADLPGIADGAVM